MTPAQTLLALAARFADLPDLPPGSPDAFTQRQAPALLSRLASKIASDDPIVAGVGREQLLAIAASWRDRTSPGAGLWAGACAAIGEAMPEPVAAPVEQGAGQNSIALLLAAAYVRGMAKGREEAGAEITALRAKVAELDGDLRGVHGLHRDALAREGDKLARIADLEAQLVAAPSGLRVAALLAAVAELGAPRRFDQTCDAVRGETAGDVADLILQHLGEPTARDLAVAKVMALDVAALRNALVTSDDPQDWFQACGDIAEGNANAGPWLSDDGDMERLIQIAAVALAGILACDAKGCA